MERENIGSREFYIPAADLGVFFTPVLGYGSLRAASSSHLRFTLFYPTWKRTLYRVKQRIRQVRVEVW